MKSILLFFAALTFGLHSSYAQRTCGSVLNLDSIEKHDPTRYQRILQIEKHIERYNEILSEEEINRSTPAIIRIPVVVHILHNGESIGTGSNISMAQIESQIDVLNEDFRRLNTDATNTPPVFQPVASDVGIEFYLACIDPDGNPTNGVIRKQGQSSYTVVNQSSDKVNESATGIKLGANGSVAWPTDKYFNMWVCNLAGNLLGYAQFPHYYTTDPSTDGIVVTTTAFGRTGNVVAPFNLGRTATHEVGHWLNLLHIWGDYVGCGGNGDFVADTPDQNNARTGCPSFPQTSCSSNDMFMNYMDYTNDGCMNIFTVGQRNRMRALFTTGGGPQEFY